MEGFIPRLMFAAPKSGSGKTMITCAILRAFKKQGLAVGAFKCGPDYIDPLFHSHVVGVPSRNVDSFFSDEELLRALFFEANRNNDTDLALIEGVMGYYDGTGADGMKASGYEIADKLMCPVVLIVDAKGMGLSVAALIKGFMEYRGDSHIRGVILNRISPMQYDMLKSAIEKELKIRVFGYVPNFAEMEFPSRHLGLVLPDEIEDLTCRMDVLADKLSQTIDLEGLNRLAKTAELFSVGTLPDVPRLPRPLTMAVARDEAFCFLYEDNLELLQRMGVQLVYFSPIHDTTLPKQAEVLLLPGGYPELYAKELRDNVSMREEIRAFLAGGHKTLAECGGFLYLTRELTDLDGNRYEMIGAIDATSFATKRLGRFGYIELEDMKTGEVIKGHEFHYFDTDNNGCDWLAKKPGREISWQCMHMSEHLIAGFPHLYYYSNPMLIYEFLAGCE